MEIHGNPVPLLCANVVDRTDFVLESLELEFRDVLVPTLSFQLPSFSDFSLCVDFRASVRCEFFMATRCRYMLPYPSGCVFAVAAAAG